MYQPKISIIIPVYNVEPYIAECLQSVMRQTYKGSIECIVVDDCGTDKSMEVAEKLIAEYDGPIEFRVLHHEHNRGLSAARNTGVENAKGDYVLFLDSDDYITDDCLEVLTAPLCEKNYEVVLGSVKTFGIPIDVVWLWKEQGAILCNESVFHEFYGSGSIYVMAINKLINHKLFLGNDLTFLEGQLHEDELWNYKLVCCINSFVVQKTTYYYRIREDSIITSKRKDWNRYLESRSLTLDYVIEHRPKVPEEDWISCVCGCFDRYIGTAYRGGIGFGKAFFRFHRKIHYCPFLKYLKGELQFRVLKRRIYMVRPPFLGYCYLWVRGVMKKICYESQ